MALSPGLPRWAGTRKVKPIWILLEQETVSGSGISWAMYKSAPRSRQITTQAPHHSVFLQAGCPSCRHTNSVEALKALLDINISQILFVFRTVVDTRKHYLCVRFVEPWNNLNCATVDFSSLRRFKCFLRQTDLLQYLKYSDFSKLQ